MKITLSLRQVVITSVLLVVTGILLVTHLFKPELDYTRRALLFLSLIVPVLLPRFNFDKPDTAYTIFFIVLSYPYGYFIVWLGKTTIMFFFFGGDTAINWLNGILMTFAGMIVFLIAHVASHGLDPIKKSAGLELAKN